MQAAALSYRVLTYPPCLENGLVVQTHVIECCICDARTDGCRSRLRVDPCDGRGDAGSAAVTRLARQECQAPADQDQRREPDRDHTQQQLRAAYRRASPHACEPDADCAT